MSQYKQAVSLFTMAMEFIRVTILSLQCRHEVLHF